MTTIDNNGACVAGVAVASATVPTNLLPVACVNHSKGYTMKNHEKLIPVSTTRIDPVIVPEHKIESPTTGAIAIDQQAKLVDIRTYRQIFEEGMAAGIFDACENPAQVNKMIGEIKGSGKPCVYMVSEVAHAWDKTTTGWVKQTDQWLAANPFVPGAGHGPRTKSSAILDPIEETALKAQAAALVALADNPAIKPLIDAINAKLKAHETALLEDATRQVSIRRRAKIVEFFTILLKEHDKTGKPYPFTVTVTEQEGEYSVTAV
jgi:hypothetical protein